MCNILYSHLAWYAQTAYDCYKRLYKYDSHSKYIRFMCLCVLIPQQKLDFEQSTQQYLLHEVGQNGRTFLRKRMRSFARIFSLPNWKMLNCLRQPSNGGTLCLPSMNRTAYRLMFWGCWIELSRRFRQGYTRGEVMSLHSPFHSSKNLFVHTNSTNSHLLNCSSAQRFIPSADGLFALWSFLTYS